MGINLLPNHSPGKDEKEEKKEKPKEQEVELYIPEELKKEQEEKLKKEKAGFWSALHDFLFVKKEKLSDFKKQKEQEKQEEKEKTETKKIFSLKGAKKKKIEDIQKEVIKKIGKKIKENKDSSLVAKEEPEKEKTFWQEPAKIGKEQAPILDKEKFSKSLAQKAKKVEKKEKQKIFWAKEQKKDLEEENKKEEVVIGEEQIFSKEKQDDKEKVFFSKKQAQKEISQEIKAGRRTEKIGFKVYQKGKEKVKIKGESFWQQWQKKIKQMFSKKKAKPKIDFIAGGELIASLKIKVKERVSFVVLVALLMFVILSSLLILFDWYRTLTIKKWAGIHQEVKNVSQKIIAERQEEQKIINFDRKLQIASYLLDHHIYWTLFLQKLEKYTLKGVYYKDIHADQNGDVSLSAYTYDYDNVAKQLKVFQRANDFVEAVKINSATQNSKGPIRFQIKLKLKKQILFKKP